MSILDFRVENIQTTSTEKKKWMWEEHEVGMCKKEDYVDRSETVMQRLVWDFVKKYSSDLEYLTQEWWLELI